MTDREIIQNLQERVEKLESDITNLNKQMSETKSFVISQTQHDDKKILSLENKK